jgi:Flp pilus assembly protein TadD
MQPGRNDPCPCGSGKKYKKCCGLAAASGIDDPARQREQTTHAFQLGDFKTAISVCLQALRTSPRDPELLHLLGLSQLHLGQLKEAVEHLEKAARLAPGHAFVLSNLALALQHLGRLDDAERRARGARA